MTMQGSIFKIIGVLLFLTMTKAYSPYRQKIPNGDKVMSACDPGKQTYTEIYLHVHQKGSLIEKIGKIEKKYDIFMI